MRALRTFRVENFQCLHVFLNKQAGLPLENEWLEHNKKWMEDDVLSQMGDFEVPAPAVNFQGCARSEFEKSTQ